MPEHSALTDPDIHEPKGITTANDTEVYVADGVGSGDWFKIYTHGWEDQHHAGSSQALTATVALKLLNDSAGAFTNTTYLLPGYSAIWDSVNNELDFAAAGLSIGDTVDIRIDTTITTSGANDDIAFLVDLAIGSGNDYTLDVDYREWRVAGTYNYVTNFRMYIGNTDTLNYPAEIKALSSASGASVQVNGWFIKVTPRNPVLA